MVGETKEEAFIEASGDTILITDAIRSIAESIAALAISVQALADSQKLDESEVSRKYDMGGDPL